MRFRRRRSLFRALPRRGLEQSEPLKGQVWTRSEQSVREPGVHLAWRGLAAASAIAECAVLGWLWFGPALSVQTVAVDGLQHMTRAQVARAAAQFAQGHMLGRLILAVLTLQQRVLLDLVVHEIGELLVRQLQHLDCLLQLRRHHQGLALTQFKPLRKPDSAVHTEELRTERLTG